ncbi:cytochrome p450 [Colletotrichum truncatum]|uniref:Cytochrome p450 n=1 Tax=Colletotrichum truncatum TaxID=5467 RepID=A0ACC3ZCM6_COLTU|nr:cytochrome p450 [Colletotrichum truncatum]KAF6782220.1 cytochrome p450 [Colletotrichum truncatum]
MDSVIIPLHWPPQLVGKLSNGTALAGALILAALLPFVLSWITADRSIPKLTSSKSWFASRQDFATHGVEIIEKGFNQVKSGVFRVTALDGSDLILLAPEHWLTLCKKKDDEVAPARKEFFLCDLHGAPFEEPFLYRYLLARMPGFDRHLDVISQALDEGISSILEKGFDYSNGARKHVIIQPQILHVYSHVIWRVILGDSFTPKVVDIFEKYSATLIPVMKALKAQRPMMARITAAFSSEVRQVNMQLERATAFFTPILQQHFQAFEQSSGTSSANNEWFEELIRMAPAEKRRDYKFLTNILIGFAFTFVFSPGPSTTQVVYEFVFRPDYTDLVLQEARDVLGEQLEDWSFTRESLRKLSLLDSFCKETHKHHPTAASNLMKKIHKTQTLSNGVVLPAGTVFEVVMTAAHLSNPSFKDPAEWNGRRYHDLRQQASSATGASKYDWGAATRDDVNFGYASHMCPGRWAGCSIAKMFLIKLLSRYEICPENGETERYRDFHSGQYVRHALKTCISLAFIYTGIVLNTALTDLRN